MHVAFFADNANEKALLSVSFPPDLPYMNTSGSLGENGWNMLRDEVKEDDSYASAGVLLEKFELYVTHKLESNGMFV